VTVAGPIDPRLLRRARSAWWPLAASVGLGAVHAALVVGQAVVLADLVAAVVIDGATVAGSSATLLLLAALVAGRALCTWLTAVTGRAAASAVKSDLRRDLLRQVVTLDPAARAGARPGEVAVLLGHGLDALDGYFIRYLPQVVLAALVPPVVVLVAAASDLTAALILAVTLPLIPVFLALVGLATRDRTERQWRAVADLGAHLLDVLEGLPTLRIFGRVRHQRRVLAELTERHRLATMAALRWAFTSSLVLELIASLGTALVAVTVGLRLAGGSLDLRTALVVLLLAPEAYLPLRNVGAAFHASTEGATAAQQALDLLDDHAAHVTLPSGGRRPVGELHPITLARVTVVHPDRARPALDEVSVTIGAGEHLGIVGPSGAGKSTLLALVMGLAVPTTGRVIVGGVDLAGVDLDDWRRHLAWLPQRPHLFADTIAANIALARPDAGEAATARAAEAAGLGELLERLPAGLRTPIGAGGLPLSGGEAQRIALARALLRNAPIVLLDEPTASLDESTERAVLESLATLLAGRTALIVTHRTAPLELVDRTLVLDDGRLLAPAHARQVAVIR
jgi:thiol reductant ABC exporter CydD subunit